MYPNHLAAAYNLGNVQHAALPGVVAEESPAINFAHGGALSFKPKWYPPSPRAWRTGPTSSILNGQVDQYLTAVPHEQASKPLYVVWTGGNDLPQALATPDTAQDNVQEYAKHLGRQIKRLVEHGARTVVVPNLPDLALTPDGARDVLKSVSAGSGVPNLDRVVDLTGILETASSPENRDQRIVAALANADASGELTKAYQAGINQLKDLTRYYNHQVNQQLQGLDAHIVRVDIQALLNDLADDPTAYGFTNVTAPALLRFSGVVQS